jgi:hypothetical protein
MARTWARTSSIPRGLWAIVIDVGKESGKRKRRWFSFHGGKREAQRRCRALSGIATDMSSVGAALVGASFNGSFHHLSPRFHSLATTVS